MTTSPRDRILGRPKPTATYKLPVADTAAAARELTEAQSELALILMGDTADLTRADEARSRVESARAGYDACFEAIVCTALEPPEFEALVDQYPARKDHPEDESWNVDTFPRELFLRCAPDYLNRQEWEEWLTTSVNEAEQIALYNTAIKANTRTVDEAIPKDWTSMLS